MRSSSGAMVLKIVASRSEARPSSASAVASSCATFASSNAAETRAMTGTSACGSSAHLHQLHGDVRVELPGREGEVAHDVGQLLGRHHRDDAGQDAERREDGGGLRGDHRRAVEGALGRQHRRRQIADVDAAGGDGEQALLRALVEDRLLAAGDLHHDRAPQIVAPGRLEDLAFVAREQRLVIELLEDERRVAVLGPDLHRAAAAPAFGGVEAEQPQQPGDALGRDLAEKRDVQQIAVVEQRRGVGDSALGLGRRDPVDEERARRDADAERGAERRLADRASRAGA